MFGVLSLWLLLCVPMFVGCMCCDVEPDSCGSCTTGIDTATWRFTMASVSNLGSPPPDCTLFNGTFDFTGLTGGIGQCDKNMDLGGSNNENYTLTIATTGSNITEVTVVADDNVQVTTVRNYSASLNGSAPDTCSTTTFDLDDTGVVGHGLCINWPATITVNRL